MSEWESTIRCATSSSVKAFIASLLVAVSACRGDSETSPSSPPSLVPVEVLAVTTDAEGGSARPEVVATSDRVFVLYLANIASGNQRRFDAKIFTANLETVVATKTLLETTADYGGPTDIRIASDGQYLYAFYETNRPTSPTTAETYLWARKYLLNDDLALVASTATPIATSKPMAELPEGGELLDDPAPLIGPNGVHVITRLKYPLGTSGRTIYRVRELSSDLIQTDGFDLELSDVVDGRARVTSLLFANDRIYIALATTVSDAHVLEANDDGAMCDLILVEMDTAWNRQSVHTLSAEPDDLENYVTGLKTDGAHLYVTYKQDVGSPPTGERRAVIKMFDWNLAELGKAIVKSVVWGPEGGEIRPSLELSGNRIFSGQSAGLGIGSGNAEIHVYELR